MLGLETLAATSAVRKGKKPAAGQAGLVSLLSLGFVEKVPQGFVAVRVHSGNYSRAQDSFILPEWKKETFYGYYERGLHTKIPWLQHFELVDLRNRVSHMNQRIKSKAQAGTDESRAVPGVVNGVVSTVVWGVPPKERADRLVEEGKIDVTYETILLRALTKASQGPHSIHTLQEVVEGIFRSGMRTILGDYIDPSEAEDKTVYSALQELKSNDLLEYGVELRAVYLGEATPVDAQILKEGLLASSSQKAGTAATAALLGPKLASVDGAGPIDIAGLSA